MSAGKSQADEVAEYFHSISQKPRTFTTPTSAEQLAGYIDHTLLKLDATEGQIDHLCEEAKLYQFKVGRLLSFLCTFNGDDDHPLKLLFCLFLVLVLYIQEVFNYIRASLVT